jgi:hypothetical protein
MSEKRRQIFERRLSLETDGSSMSVSPGEATHCIKCVRVPLSRLVAYPLQLHCVVLSDDKFIEMLGAIPNKVVEPEPKRPERIVVEEPGPKRAKRL